MTSPAARVLYHFAHSPFSRRTRLALAHKGLDCELREARDNPAWREQAGRLVAQKTIPVLVDGDVALADSTAITRWLDAKYVTSPRIWPETGDTRVSLEVATLVDTALNHIIDVGTRYYPLHDHPSFAHVKAEMLGRSQRALEALAAHAATRAGSPLSSSGWSAADMWLYTAVAWLDGLPHRVHASTNAAQIVAVGGWTLPGDLRRWADSHRDRPDVKALG
jgi:glutathione S-transferase